MIQTGASVVAPTGMLRLCRDVSDDVVLETALLGRAKYLVSRDADMVRDLAVIRVFRERGIQIVTVGQLLQLLRRKP